jgi:hypothetical protein
MTQRRQEGRGPGDRAERQPSLQQRDRQQNDVDHYEETSAGAIGSRRGKTFLHLALCSQRTDLFRRHEIDTTLGAIGMDRVNVLYAGKTREGPNRVIVGKGTRTPQGRQPCRLLLKLLLPPRQSWGICLVGLDRTAKAIFSWRSVIETRWHGSMLSNAR